jgi:hypothetical protein
VVVLSDDEEEQQSHGLYAFPRIPHLRVTYGDISELH